MFLRPASSDLTQGSPSRLPSFVYSQIQGPVSSSKYFSKRHKKMAPAAQMSANVINQTMITAQFDTQ
jgi:hypothetical protein